MLHFCTKFVNSFFVNSHNYTHFFLISRTWKGRFSVYKYARKLQLFGLYCILDRFWTSNTLCLTCMIPALFAGIKSKDHRFILFNSIQIIYAFLNSTNNIDKNISLKGIEKMKQKEVYMQLYRGVWGGIQLWLICSNHLSTSHFFPFHNTRNGDMDCFTQVKVIK